MKSIIIKDSIFNSVGVQQNINLLTVNDIKIVDSSSGIYFCDVFVKTRSFQVELFDVSITEIEFIRIKNDLIGFLQNTESYVEFEQLESLFKIRFERNSGNNDSFKLFINVRDLYYGEMNIKTNISKESLKELIEQIYENIEPIDQKLWAMSNLEIKEHFIEKWRQEGLFK